MLLFDNLKPMNQNQVGLKNLKLLSIKQHPTSKHWISNIDNYRKERKNFSSYDYHTLP